MTSEGGLESRELERFEAVVLPHLDAAYTLARYLTRNAHDAEDIVQDACLRAIRHFESFSGEGETSARAWLLAIVRNAAYSARRRHRAEDAATEFDETFHSDYPLLGGRLDYAGGRAVAALVYGRRQHLINVFLWPAARGPSGGPSTTTSQGYHLLHWKTGDYAYWPVSDLGLPELEDFASLLRKAAAAANAPN